MNKLKRFRYKCDHITHAKLKLLADLEHMTMEEYALAAIKEKAERDAAKYPFLSQEFIEQREACGS